MFLIILPLLLLMGQTQPPDDTTDPINAATKLVAKAMLSLPAWEDDKLAQFERPELAAVRADLKACMSADGDAEFLKAVKQLIADTDMLVSLDDALATNLDVI